MVQLEVLAIQCTVDHYKYYLWVTVMTNHASLQWLNRMKDTNPRLMHWYLALQPYNFLIHYRKGRQHTNADLFSQQAVWNALEQQAGLEGSVCEPHRASVLFRALESSPSPPSHPARGGCTKCSAAFDTTSPCSEA